MKKRKKKLIESVHEALDWDVIRQLITEKHLNDPDNRLVFQSGDLVVHDNRIVYQLDFEIQVPLSVIFSRDGECLEITPPRKKPSRSSKSARELTEIRERSSGKVEQLAASIADMINEINQSDTSQ